MAPRWRGRALSGEQVLRARGLLRGKHPSWAGYPKPGTPGPTYVAAGTSPGGGRMRRGENLAGWLGPWPDSLWPFPGSWPQGPLGESSRPLAQPPTTRVSQLLRTPPAGSCQASGASPLRTRLHSLPGTAAITSRRGTGRLGSPPDTAQPNSSPNPAPAAGSPWGPTGTPHSRGDPERSRGQLGSPAKGRERPREERLLQRGEHVTCSNLPSGSCPPSPSLGHSCPQPTPGLPCC
ncbi:hypothetical protein KIL84_005906 [Mauremys mutica]|uniref:Uncharacterized protein n=1 Tax=Mauremys mutica TaxID=74926 RepID=A0A9D3XHT4_9SAUR|nr:hypothetical protein KIL84_005906 [Mauremys mutica]